MDFETVRSITQSWSNITTLLTTKHSDRYGVVASLSESVRNLEEHGLLEKLLELLADGFCREWSETLVPRFWNGIPDLYDADMEHSINILESALMAAANLLSLSREKYLKTVRFITSHSQTPRKTTLRNFPVTDGLNSAEMTYASPPFHKELLQFYFSHGLQQLNQCFYSHRSASGLPLPDRDEGKSMAESWENLQEKLDTVSGNGQLATPLSPVSGDGSGSDWRSTFSHVCQLMWIIGLGSVCSDVLQSLLLQELSGQVSSFAEMGFQESVSDYASAWIQNVAVVLLSLLPSQMDPDSRMTVKELDGWQTKLMEIMYRTLGTIRLKDLFEIVVDYPESRPAVMDLKLCVAQTCSLPEVTSSFQLALANRLLTPGASTHDILMHYVSTIQTLRDLDPTGLVLDAVTGPIRTYLRQRRDSVRCIVSMLTSDDTAAAAHGLTLDLPAGNSLALDADSGDDDEVGPDDWEAEFSAMDRWVPDPIESNPTERVRKSHDLVRMLVDAVGSREPITVEYRTSLADRLLAKSDYNTDKEVHTLELMKLRFGEAALLNCEVMLRDMADSKRVNSHIHKAAAAAAEAAAMAAGAPTPSGGPTPSPTPMQSPSSSSQWLPRGFGISAPHRDHNYSPVSSVPWPRFAGADITYPYLPPGLMPPMDPLPPTAGSLPGSSAGGTVTPPPAVMVPFFPSGGQTPRRPAGGVTPVIIDESPPGSHSWQGPVPIRRDAELDMISATIVSALFWPTVQEETFNLPEAIENLLDEYANHFHTLKTPRKLKWIPNLGTVKLELTFDDGAVEYTVTPMQASLIHLFQEKQQWSLDDMAASLGASISNVKRRISFWVNQNVLVEARGRSEMDILYTCVSHLGSRDGGQRDSAAGAAAGNDDNYDEGSVMDDRPNLEWAVHESFIVGMLTTFGDGLPLDRIHNMLKMFVVDPPYEKTAQQLQGFLNRLIGEEKIEFKDGKYKKRS